MERILFELKVWEELFKNQVQSLSLCSVESSTRASFWALFIFSLSLYEILFSFSPARIKWAFKPTLIPLTVTKVRWLWFWRECFFSQIIQNSKWIILSPSCCSVAALCLPIIKCVHSLSTFLYISRYLSYRILILIVLNYLWRFWSFLSHCLSLGSQTDRLKCLLLSTRWDCLDGTVSLSLSPTHAFTWPERVKVHICLYYNFSTLLIIVLILIPLTDPRSFHSWFQTVLDARPMNENVFFWLNILLRKLTFSLSKWRSSCWPYKVTLMFSPPLLTAEAHSDGKNIGGNDNFFLFVYRTESALFSPSS